ncbi:MAG: FGGY-family carbohydrate kinase [Micrococcales bacterium]|nr:FGGY-family carbohydrate kinase [Micrococcales bacterium]
MSDAWLGIDLGTQSARAIVLGDDGATLASASAPLSSRRAEGRHEQDPGEWLRVVREIIRGAVRELPAGVRIRALAVDGTSGTVVPLDRRGRPTGVAAMYDDRRGAPYLDRVLDAGGEQWRRMGYRMQATWALPKLLALREESPAQLWGHQVDVVVDDLSGHPLATDLSNALKTGADLDAVAWPVDVLDRLGLALGELPAVVESGSILGAVSDAVADDTGLPRGCAIVAGATDGVAAQLGSGAIRVGDGASVLGTTLVLKGVAARRALDPSGAVYAHRAPFGAGWFPGGASSVGAGAVSALLPGRDPATLTAAAARRSEIPVCYPLLGLGERFPFVADRAPGFWPRDPSDMADDELLRAIAFGVAFLERLALERMAALGAPMARIATSGGGVRNAWWTSLRAAVSRRPFTVPAQTEGAAGMAVLAAAAVGDTPGDLDATTRRLIPRGRPVQPLGLDDDRVEEAYGLFRRRIAELVQEEAA